MRHRFDSWSRKIPQVPEQLSLCATTAELVLQSPGSATDELTCHSFWSLSALESVLCNKLAPQLESSHHSPQLEKSLVAMKTQHGQKKKKRERERDNKMWITHASHIITIFLVATLKKKKTIVRDRWNELAYYIEFNISTILSIQNVINIELLVGFFP